MGSRAPALSTTLVTKLSSHTAPVNAITFSSLGGTYILTGSSDRQIHLSRSEPSTTNTKTSPETPSLPIQKYSAHGYAVLDIAVSSDNQTFASVGGDRAVFLWDVQNATGTSRRFGSGNASTAHTSRITCVSFAGEDDSVLVSGSDDRSVRLWDVKSRDAKPLMVMEEAKDGISCLAVARNGVEIVAGSIDGRVRCYDVRMGKVTIDVQPGPVTSLDLSADAKMMVVGCLDGKVRVMDRADGSCLRAFPAEDQYDHGYRNESLRLRSCLGASEKLILSGSEADGNVRAWDILSAKTVGTVEVNTTGKVVSVVKWREGSQAQSRRGLWAAGGAEGIVKIYAEQ